MSNDYSPEKLRELSARITSDPEFINNMDPAEVVELRKQLDPLGSIAKTKKSYVNMSIVNWRESYLRKLFMTAMVGYLYRIADEYESEEEIARENARFAKLTEQMDTNSEEFKTAQGVHDDRVKLILSTSRGIIKRFLNRNFNYNPDVHVRGSHTDAKTDPERKDKDDLIRETCLQAESASMIENKMQEKPEAYYKFNRNSLLTVYNHTVEVTNCLKSALSVMLDPHVDIEDKQGVLIKKYKQLRDIADELKKVAEPLVAADTIDAIKIDPPADVYHNFNRYFTNHYEQLREVCKALFNEKPDLEYAITLYDTFKTPEAAREYKIQHESEFRSEVFTIESGAVTLLGPFNENRQRVNFYNKNTEVMKRMMEQMESDHKLGKDLMEKKVRKEKKKNIDEMGVDNPGLAAYAKTMNTVQDLGAKKILTREEQEEYVAAKKKAEQLREDYEIPDEAIQVDVFFPKTNADGEVELSKTKFYTQAEAPLHMQEGSHYMEQYQPKRVPGESMAEAYVTKTITSRTGQKMEIKVPVDQQ